MNRLALEFLMLASLVFMVVAFGGNTPWAMAIFSILIMGGAAWVLMVPGRTPVFERLPGKRPLLLSLVPLALVSLQLMPLPRPLLRLISPVQAGFLDRAEATGAFPPGMVLPAISAFPANTLTHLILWVALVAMFWLGWAILQRREPLRRLTAGLVLLGLAEAAFGLLQYLGKFPHIFLPPRVAEATVASGTYINRNHFAAFLGMVLPLLLGVAYAFFYGRIWPQLTIRRRWRSFMAHPSSGFFLLLMFGGVIMCLGIVFSMSRSGIAASLATLCFLAALLSLKHSRRRFQAIMVTFLLVVAGYAAWMGLEDVIARFETILSEDSILQEGRLLAWQDTLALIGDFPLTGVGLGNYRYVFHRYNTVPRSVIYDHAHNDYLEYVAELGLPGGLFLFCLVLALWIRSVRGFFHTVDLHRRAAFLGASGGVLNLLLHSATDFNLQIPANMAVFTLLLALAAASLCAEETSPVPRTVPVRQAQP